ncbi:MAG: ATP-binding protein [Dehalococcoidia bacterium]|nr:ATP-binding protein [Dehalococcoidia bacterium]
MNNDSRLGMVVAGSLSGGVAVRLDGDASVEDVVVGRYVSIEGKKRRFLGMITDVKLDTSDQQLTISPPDPSDTFSAEVLSGTGAYGVLTVTPYLVIGGDQTITEGPQPVKTIPSHFAPVGLASDTDIEQVFGKEDAQRFYVGNPLDMESKLCLNLPELARRSNGIFGKSGTGKTFLTRTLLVGMLQKGACVNLVFDMHSEYGWEGTSEKGRKVKALKQLFPSKVAIFALDEDNARRRQVAADVFVKIGYDEMEPKDIALLKQTLNLTDLAVEASFTLRKRFGKDWIVKTLELETAENGEQELKSLNIHESSFQSLLRGLTAIKRLGFMQPHVERRAIDQLLGYLERGTHVVLEFGRYTEITAYILVSNMLTRRIYERYRENTETALAGDRTPPTPLVITIEEAHKFLNPEVAPQTIFGDIAREMRKFNCTLLVIDQRPSGIDPEVMSQLGTKITCLLDNDRDVDAVLSGISGKSELKGVLAKLAAKQQALIFGHAVPMPVAFTPREYGSAQSYKELAAESERPPQDIDKDIDNLWK